MDVEILGIDLAKRVFQLHGADHRGRALHRAKVIQSELLESVRQLHPRTIAMEACSSAHHWARQFQAIGIEVKLVSPHYVKPFVKTNKNDRNDAEAIVEAACRPSMNFVPVKSVEQQDIQAIHRTRELLVHQRPPSSTKSGDCSLKEASPWAGLQQRSKRLSLEFLRKRRAN